MTRIARSAVALATLTLSACGVDVATKPVFVDYAAVGSSSVADTTAPIVVSDPSTPGTFGVGVRYVEDEGALGTVELTVWYPAVPVRRSTHWSHSRAVLEAPVADGGDWPVVLLSHGDGEVPESLAYLADHLASRGYVVVAPSHLDRSQRLDDLALGLDAIDALQADADDPLGGRVAIDRVAALGHAEGALAVERIAAVDGDPRVAAAISVSPVAQDLPVLDAPVLFVGGDIDASCDLQARASAAEASALIVIDDAIPMAFTDACAMGAVRTAHCLTPIGARPVADVHRRVQWWVTVFLSNQTFDV